MPLVRYAGICPLPSRHWSDVSTLWRRASPATVYTVPYSCRCRVPGRPNGLTLGGGGFTLGGGGFTLGGGGFTLGGGGFTWSWTSTGSVFPKPFDMTWRTKIPTRRGGGILGGIFGGLCYEATPPPPILGFSGGRGRVETVF
eukprot:86927-Prorocentrum_minimum.AAC.1